MKADVDERTAKQGLVPEIEEDCTFKPALTSKPFDAKQMKKIQAKAQSKEPKSRVKKSNQEGPERPDHFNKLLV